MNWSFSSTVLPCIHYLVLVMAIFITDTHARSRDGWGPWTDWSLCSTSCGQGLVYSQRTCHRLERRNSCPGHSKRFKTCNFGDCPGLPPNPTIEECKKQNRMYYGGKRFYWEPYINPRTPCELSCKARGHHYIYNIKRLAQDGTDCSVKHPAVCLAGKCLRVGCDGILGSRAKPDRCGVCDGNGNSCRLISGYFKKSLLGKYGYNHVVTIPPDARSINVSELARSRNFLVLKSEGKYYINGHRRLHRTGNYQVAGTTFVYSRRQGSNCPGECLSSLGPTNQSVEIEILYYHKNPGIKYQYTLLHKPRDSVETAAGVPLLKPIEGGIHDYNNIPEEGIPLSKPYIPPGGVPLVKPNYANPGGPLIRKSSDNRLIIRNRATSGELIKNSYSSGQYPYYIPNKINTNNELSGHVLPTDNKALQKHYIHTNNPSKQAVRSSYGSRLLNNSSVPNGFKDVTRESNSIFNEGVYSWSISGFSPCSESCGGGLQDTKIICLKGKSKVVVTDDNCNIGDKPLVQKVICNTEPCHADWYTGNWSSCSVTCDKGVQSRLVECRRRISPTLVLSVSADLCIEIPKPQRTRPCQITTCIRWQVGNWTKCTTECGHGQRTREVTCIDAADMRLDDSNCTQVKPEIEEICDMGSCVKGWYHTKWSKKCSKDCGRGYLTRDIFCSSDAGEHLPDKHCSPASKPSTRKSCKNKKSCGGFWFIGPWSECNSTCGYSVKTRGIACMRELRNGLYTTTNVNKCSAEKPSTEEVCTGLPLCKPKWYMTAWGECSKSCGTGVKRREVKCLNSNLEPDMTCGQSHTKPSERQSCNKETCEEINFGLQRDSSGGDCKDKYKQWCGFVKQARICGYKYYKELCCKSCSILI